MPLRQVTGGQVAASAWLLPGNTIVFVKLTQQEFLANEIARSLETYRMPHPSAQHLMSTGGMPALDTIDGYPNPGDYWEIVHTDRQGVKTSTLHCQTGTDLFGYWGVERKRQMTDAQGRPVIDQFTGAAREEVWFSMLASHKDVVPDFDMKNAATYLPAPPTRVIDTTVRPAVSGGQIGGV